MYLKNQKRNTSIFVLSKINLDKNLKELWLFSGSGFAFGSGDANKQGLFGAGGNNAGKHISFLYFIALLCRSKLFLQ